LSAEDEHVHLRQELEAAKEGAHQLHVELIRVEGRRDALEEHSQKLLATLDAAESSKTALEARLEEVEADLAAITNNAQAARQAAEKWQSQFEAADEENKDLSEKLQEREAEKMTLEAELQVLAATSQKQKLEIATAGEEKTDLERQLEKSREEASEATQILEEEFAKARDACELELSAANEGTQKLLTRLAEVEADWAAIDKNAEAATLAAEKWQSQFEAADEENKDLSEKLQEREAEKMTLEAELQVLAATSQKQKLEIATAEEEKTDVEWQLEKSRQEASEAAQTLKEAGETWELELSAATEGTQKLLAMLDAAESSKRTLEARLAEVEADLLETKAGSHLEPSEAVAEVQLVRAEVRAAVAQLEQQFVGAEADSSQMLEDDLYASKVASDLELSAAKETLQLQQAQLVAATEKQAELEQQLVRAEGDISQMSEDEFIAAKVAWNLELSAAKETMQLQQAQLVAATKKQAELAQQLIRAEADSTQMSEDELVAKVDSDLELSAAAETLRLQQAQLVVATEKQAELEQQLARARAEATLKSDDDLHTSRVASDLELSAAKETLQLQQAQLVAATEKQAELEQQLAGASAEAALRPEDKFSAYSGRAEARETEFVAAKVAGNLELSAAKETSQLQPAQLVAATDKQAELDQHLARTEADSSQMSDSLHGPASKVDSDLELSAAK
ncbi:unnamed protein product, partial [Polarella glacialis]